jgi:hypothetical protein
MGLMAGDQSDGPVRVELVADNTDEQGRRWSPVVGEETLELLSHLGIPKVSADRVRDEAVDVLGRCVPPTASPERETGLAIGYVQSGKTMSFTTVAALARDNGYQIVIVIAGTSIPLLAQSTERLVTDLRINQDNRGWQLFESRLLQKGAIPSAREQLRATLNTWRGGTTLPFSWMRRTALIVAMKHHGHLDRVRALLDGLDLRKVPTLVIDDEADQASLNAAVRKNDESKTYAQIKRLRECLPHHTFLQYTATPQAPLLLNIIDSLSPRFAEVLTPGPDYVGGKDFFLAGTAQLVRGIPADELPALSGSDSAPESLLIALRLFFVGAAAGFVHEKGKGNRSMLVHPSQQRAGHSEYYSWVVDARKEWAHLLNAGPEYQEDRAELLEDFKSAYDDIAATAADIPSLLEINSTLPWLVANTVVQEVNAKEGETPKVNWKSDFAHILVGGQAMDRGFTVEGLTVTYMPRSIGVGNADTVQQRARFFGYKRSYLGYCRVFLEDASINAYRRYVAHEEDMRRRLIAHRKTGKPLVDWKRMFYLDKSLRPTRTSVLELDYYRGASSVKEWFTPRMPHITVEGEVDVVSENRAILAETRARMAGVLRPDPGSDERSDYQRHQVARVALRSLFESCLLRLRFTDSADSQGYTVVQLLLAELLDRVPDQTCVVYVMSGGRPRKRTVNDDGEIKNLFQGADPSEPKVDVGKVYPGDRKLVDREAPTVQVHYLDIYSERRAGSARRAEELLTSNVPTIAIHLPLEMAEDLLIQPQPHQGQEHG